MFLSFDGPDGGGKSTQMELCCQWLRERGREVQTCRDPGGTKLGEELRNILLHKAETPICSRSEMLLYMASRAQLIEEIIRPSWASGKVVVSDRYVLANIVYQGYARGLDIEEIRRVGAITTAGLMPDLTFVFDVPTEVAMQRMNRDLDRMESAGVEFHERVRQGFLAESRVYPSPVVVLDATRSIEEIQTEVRTRVSELFENIHHGDTETERGRGGG